jgi:N-terminal acetyltransferase B complex catalytic subunit
MSLIDYLIKILHLPLVLLHRLAISMYEKFGYVKYRRVLGYYSGDDSEDAYDMRKALPRDKEKKSIIPMDRPVLPEELEW